MTETLSLFSGGGGLDLGFISEGYTILKAVDNAESAVATYRKNIGSHVACEDLNTLDLTTLPKASIVIGGPPCQSFSLSGKRDTSDARGTLVWRFIDVLKEVQPKAFLFENVTGLLSAKNKAGLVVDQLVQAFSRIGYTVSLKVLNAADYGVPQRRKRVIIVGLQSNKTFIFPESTHASVSSLLHKKYVSVEQALSDLPSASNLNAEVLHYTTSPQNEYQVAMRRGNSVTEHTVPQMSELDKYICSHVREGGNYMDIPKEVNSQRIRRLQREGGRTTSYGRLHREKPAYTINTYFNRPNVGCNIHYSENRLITIREALRLQSFPDDYVLVSKNKRDKHTIVGNAVPPLLAKSLANQLKAYL